MRLSCTMPTLFGKSSSTRMFEFASASSEVKPNQYKTAPGPKRFKYLAYCDSCCCLRTHMILVKVIA